MAGPNTLPYGGNVEYPTWVFGNTRLYVQNSDRHYPGKVTVWASGATEDFIVNGGHTDHIERYWGGVHISVSNTGGPPLTVWTA